MHSNSDGNKWNWPPHMLWPEYVMVNNFTHQQQSSATGHPTVNHLTGKSGNKRINKKALHQLSQTPQITNCPKEMGQYEVVKVTSL